MTLPILSYGHPILRKGCSEIDRNYPELDKLINDMWETMEGASGCGLAAPQVNKPIKLFIVDSETTYELMEEIDRKEYYDGDTGIKETFINAKIRERSEKEWSDDEGCLSIPNLSQKVKRPWTITIEYYNKDFDFQTKTFSGTTARMIQHEHDHTEGILYLDHLDPLTKKLMESKLKKIVKGQVKTKYPMKFV